MQRISEMAAGSILLSIICLLFFACSGRNEVCASIPHVWYPSSDSFVVGILVDTPKYSTFIFAKNFNGDKVKLFLENDIIELQMRKAPYVPLAGTQHVPQEYSGRVDIQIENRYLTSVFIDQGHPQDYVISFNRPRDTIFIYRSRPTYGYE